MPVPASDVERREEIGDAVADVVVRVALRLAWRMGIAGAVSLCAAMGGFSSTHPFGRMQIEPYDVAHLVHEVRVGGELEATENKRLAS
ncbi:hypothetical protein FRC97_03460 [Paracidovorax citrulli]|nr:hypothetical protein CQB05_22500 [Paracidovorax citrulli]UMT85907.1 hypothetical protein FRC75_22570 [Paracidovorax citrulli]UMT90106.1 hypothetical protein FRC90_19865 [Paracidovorax citrulli]UMT94142.1 hypothetical protein FRC97_03460 [Paracidovorax citrulli]